MAQNKDYLIWIDMEMTGLLPDVDRIIEIAIVVTDGNLNTIAEAPVLVVHQADLVLDGMDSWNKSVRKFYLPRSTFSCALDAQAGDLFPLSKFRCEHLKGAR